MHHDDEEDPVAETSHARVIADAISREKVIKRIQSNRRGQIEGRNRSYSLDSNEAESSFDEGDNRDDSLSTPKPSALDIREVLFDAIPEVRTSLVTRLIISNLLALSSHIPIPRSSSVFKYLK